MRAAIVAIRSLDLPSGCHFDFGFCCFFARLSEKKLQ
jgi:hypothetical protein